MKKALVTGGAGFIGSNMCDRLLGDGYFVYCVDNLYSGHLKNLKHLEQHPNFTYIHTDVCGLSDLEVDEIYNLACPASPKHYQSNPLFTINTSINGAIHMAQLAQKLKCKLFQASTSEVYGEPLVHPQPESYWGNVNPNGPRSCYDESKRMAESILFNMHKQQPFPLKVGRIFNTYGPKMHPDDGRVISSFITQAILGQDITVYGDGNQTRSFCYIDDLINGIIKFMHSPDDITGPINLGNDKEFTINELAETVIKLVGSNSKIIFDPLPTDDPTRRRPDITLAKKQLHWQPVVPLKEGLEHTIRYYRTVLEPIL